MALYFFQTRSASPLEIDHGCHIPIHYTCALQPRQWLKMAQVYCMPGAKWSRCSRTSIPGRGQALVPSGSNRWSLPGMLVLASNLNYAQMAPADRVAALLVDTR